MIATIVAPTLPAALTPPAPITEKPSSGSGKGRGRPSGTTATTTTKRHNAEMSNNSSAGVDKDGELLAVPKHKAQKTVTASHSLGQDSTSMIEKFVGVHKELTAVHHTNTMAVVNAFTQNSSSVMGQVGTMIGCYKNSTPPEQLPFHGISHAKSPSLSRPFFKCRDIVKKNLTNCEIATDRFGAHQLYTSVLHELMVTEGDMIVGAGSSSQHDLLKYTIDKYGLDAANEGSDIA